MNKKIWSKPLKKPKLKPQTTKGVYLKNDNVSLWLGDFLKQKIPPNSVDLVLTSPRYNAGIDYGGNVNDMTDPDVYVQEMINSIVKCFYILKDGGHIAWVTPLYVNEKRTRNGEKIPDEEWQWGSSYKTHLYWSKITAGVEDFFKYRRFLTMYTKQEIRIDPKDPLWMVGVIPWIKPAGVSREMITKVGSISNKPHPINSWEIITIWRKGHKNRNGIPGITPNKQFISLMSQEWRIQPETRVKAVDHPVPYPEELTDRVIECFTVKGDIVFDPYIGSGTTGRSAMKLGRKIWGAEIVERHLKNAIRRMSLEYKKLDW